ncbi:hypothetical protein VTL71DRAFT_8602 [Oculimacula yallundae]|uniref:Ubiquitin-like domain-containing protein n=1 Tax=Oculimacula yallundae TaxID=86028 RepID=A0ABR4CY26_9HELO
MQKYQAVPQSPSIAVIMLKFKCLIRDKDKTSSRKADRYINVERRGETKVVDFSSWVKTQQQLPGKLYLYYKDDILDDPSLKLSEVLKDGEELKIVFDKTIRSGGAGIGEGGQIHHLANGLGEGGHGEGGYMSKDKVRGGDGYGGAATANVEGKKGTIKGGDGIGGPGSTGGQPGVAIGGEGVGGTATYG